MKKLIKTFPVLAGICWGSGGIFVRVLLAAGLSNMTIVFARLAMSVLLTAVWILITDKSLLRITKKDIPILALTGILGYCFMNVFYNLSIQYLSMALAAVLLCTAPVYVIIFGAIVFKEKITPLKVICMLSVLFGCLLLSGIVDSGKLQWSLFGLAMGVACSLANAVCTLGCNEASGVRGLHPLTMIFYNSLFAMVPSIFLADFGRLAEYVSNAPLEGIGVIFLNALFTSLLPNLFFNYSFKHMESGVVSILASGAEPTAALIFGILIYSEIPTLTGFIGMVIVVGSILVLTGSKQEKKRLERVT